MHKLINLTGKKYGKHVFEKLKIVPQNGIPYNINKSGTVNGAPFLNFVFLPFC